VAGLCAASVEGLALRAQEFIFRPGPLRAGEYRFDVGTAGSIPLVLQACLPAAFAAKGPVTLRVSGGTDVKAAPPLDYLRFVFLPLLERMDLHAEIRVLHRGYYPRGGGHVEVAVAPGTPRPLVLESAGALEAIEGAAHVANLPLHIVERMQRTAERCLRDYPAVRIAPDVLGHDRAFGPGGALVLWARTAHALLGAGEVAQRGVPAERIAETAAEALRAELGTGATLDLHASDQILLYCALARGASMFLARAWTSHAQTTAWLIGQFLPVRIRALAQGALTRVEIAPA
jgi:RNA 3'-phosphate cyclase